MRTYLDLLAQRDFRALESLAAKELARTAAPEAALMLAHARVRQGQLPSARDALRELARLDPERRELACEMASMCEREIEACRDEHTSAWRIAADVLAFAFGWSGGAKRRRHVDPWLGFREDEPVAGHAVFTSGEAVEFDDVRDADDGLGRRLLLFGSERAWKVPFGAIAEVQLLPPSGAMGFDDLWAPAQVGLKARDGSGPLRGGIPCLYAKSLESRDDQVAAGAMTLFSYSAGRRSALGQRDYAISHDGSVTLVGVRQLESLTFK